MIAVQFVHLNFLWLQFVYRHIKLTHTHTYTYIYHCISGSAQCRVHFLLPTYTSSARSSCLYKFWLNCVFKYLKTKTFWFHFCSFIPPQSIIKVLCFIMCVYFQKPFTQLPLTFKDLFYNSWFCIHYTYDLHIYQKRQKLNSLDKWIKIACSPHLNEWHCKSCVHM